MAENNAENNINNIDDFKVEEAFARLEEINQKLADKNTSLKDALELYTEGVKLAAKCKENLEGVEKEIKILNEV